MKPLTVMERGKLVGEMWQSLDAQTKKVYEDKWIALKKKYDEEYAAFVEKNPDYEE